MVRPIHGAKPVMLKGLLAGLLRRGAARAPGDAAAPQIEQAIRLLQLHDDAGAAQICERVLERDPGMVKAWELLGVVALNLGDYPLAVERFERVLALAGDEAQALANAAEANRRADRGDRALGLIERALALKPATPRFCIFACLHWKLPGAAKRRSRRCREALELHPDYPALHTSLMTLLNRAGADPRLVLERIAAGRNAARLRQWMPRRTEMRRNPGAACASATSPPIFAATR